MSEDLRIDHIQSDKPRLVLFRTIRDNLPSFILRHFRQQEACLELFFTLRVVEGDCDFDAECTTHEADIAMFESGVYSQFARIDNVMAHQHVARVGFFNGDPYCSSRLVFLQDMRRYNVETCFTFSTRLGEYLDNTDLELFYWPNFIDPSIYRDYGLAKSVPILFTGSVASHYPWRNRVRAALTPLFPTLTCPHPGWFDAQAARRTPEGEEYARLINAARAVPSCGTISEEVVRKHFEIPGCRTLLITERSSGLLAAGFRDMENCVFAEPETVVDVFEALTRDTATYERIVSAGHELVHTRHTDRKRSQIREWYDLRQGMPAGARLRQATPFASIRFDAGEKATIVARSRLRGLCAEGEWLLARGAEAEAARVFARCLNYHPLPEALVGLARCRLLQGDADSAAEMLADWIEGVLEHYERPDPDPVEVAWLAASYLCQGLTRKAAELMDRFPDLAHPEIDHALAALTLLDPKTSSRRSTAPALGRSLSLHVPTSKTRGEWMATLARMLAACGQDGGARRLRGEPGGWELAKSAPDQQRIVQMLSAAAAAARHTEQAHWLRRAVEPFARAAVRGGRLPRLARLPIARWLARFDEFFAVIGAVAPRAYGVEALVVCEAVPSVYAEEFIRRLVANPEVGEITLAGPVSTGSVAVGEPRPRVVSLQVFKNEVRAADILFLEVDRTCPPEVEQMAMQAQLIVVHGTTNRIGLRVFGRLSASGGHLLVAHDPDYGRGYAVFERRMLTNGSSRSKSCPLQDQVTDTGNE